MKKINISEDIYFAVFGWAFMHFNGNIHLQHPFVYGKSI
jgi:hypothetical protein